MIESIINNWELILAAIGFVFAGFKWFKEHQSNIQGDTLLRLLKRAGESLATLTPDDYKSNSERALAAIEAVKDIWNDPKAGDAVMAVAAASAEAEIAKISDAAAKKESGD